MKQNYSWKIIVYFLTNQTRLDRKDGHLDSCLWAKTWKFSRRSLASGSFVYLPWCPLLIDVPDFEAFVLNEFVVRCTTFSAPQRTDSKLEFLRIGDHGNVFKCFYSLFDAMWQEALISTLMVTMGNNFFLNSLINIAYNLMTVREDAAFPVCSQNKSVYFRSVQDFEL